MISELNVYISFAVQKIAVKCCSVVHTEMCIKHFVIFLSSIVLVLFACQWGKNKEEKSLEQPLEMLRKMTGGKVVGGCASILSVVLMGLGEGEGETTLPVF